MSAVARSGARRYWWIWVAAIPLLVWALIRCFGLERGFPAVVFVAYTPYAAVAALLVAGVATALRNWAAALLTALATILLLAAVLPRALGDGAAAAPSPDRRLDVLSANVYRGKGDPADLLALVRERGTDLLAVQELSPDYADALEAAGVRELLPYTVISVAPGESGGGIYSRFPLRRLTEARPFSFRMPRAEARLPRGRSLRIVDVHPYTPKHATDGAWEKGLRSLPTSGPGGVPWLLIGDFNATLDHAELRDVVDRGYRDAADVTGEGLEPTWPVGLGLIPPPVTIDHVLVDRRFGIAGYGVEELPGSDHRAIHAEIVLPY